MPGTGGGGGIGCAGRPGRGLLRHRVRPDRACWLRLHALRSSSRCNAESYGSSRRHRAAGCPWPDRSGHGGRRRSVRQPIVAVIRPVRTPINAIRSASTAGTQLVPPSRITKTPSGFAVVLVPLWLTLATGITVDPSGVWYGSANTRPAASSANWSRKASGFGNLASAWSGVDGRQRRAPDPLSARPSPTTAGRRGCSVAGYVRTTRWRRRTRADRAQAAQPVHRWR